MRTGIILNTDDIDPEVARVGAPAEIRIGPVQMTGPVPPMFYFRVCAREPDPP